MIDLRRVKASQYSGGDVVLVSSNPPSTDESRKLATKAKGPLSVVAALPNDRYVVTDLPDLKGESTWTSVVAVDICGHELHLTLYKRSGKCVYLFLGQV